jgi:hypothetical protein
MKQRVDWLPAATLPDRGEVLRLQGIPADLEPPPRIAAIYDAARAAYLDAAEPRALVGDISRERFAAVYRGEGRNAPVSPIDEVVSRAEALVLFVATVGARVSDRIGALFAANEPALAAMLDSVASAAADRLTVLLSLRYPAGAGERAASDWQTLGYSPGYCGWHVSGQRALFEYLAPGEIGVTLNASYLMSPLKSVSGVLAAGHQDIHRFRPAYPFCAECRDKPCLGRIRSTTGPAAAGISSPGLEES